MLTGLGHGAVGSGHDQDGAVHLRSAGDHVLDIVGVAGAVDVGIVTVFGLIFHVSGVDCDTAGTLFGSLIDVGVIHEIRVTLQVQDLGDGRGQGGLSMVDVADGADVHMGLISFEFCLCHNGVPPLSTSIVL